MNRLVPAYRFCIQEAIAHKKRKWAAPGHRRPCAVMRLLEMTDAVLNACYRDYYGLIHKRYLIIGNDLLVNRLAALVLAGKGMSVLIVEHELKEDDPLRLRYELPLPGLHELVAELMDLEIDHTHTLMEQIEIAISSLCDSDGLPLVERLDGALLQHDHSENGHHFWVDASWDKGAPTRLPILQCWDYLALERLKKDKGKCPHFRAHFDKAILTSNSQYSRLKSINTPLTALSDADKPLGAYDIYRGRDRLRDILESIKVVQHEQDIPSTDQYNPRL